MNCEDFQQIAAAHSVGGLDLAGQRQLEAFLASNAIAAAEFVRVTDAMLAAVECSIPLHEPSARLKLAIMNRVSRHPRVVQGSNSTLPSLAIADESELSTQKVRLPISPKTLAELTSQAKSLSPWDTLSDSHGFYFTPANSPWIQGSIPGVRYQVLSATPESSYAMLVIGLEPGAALPEHEHIGHEELYMLTGDLRTGDRILGPGDSLRADPGSYHDALTSEKGCTAILVVSRPVYRALTCA